MANELKQTGQRKWQFRRRGICVQGHSEGGWFGFAVESETMTAVKEEDIEGVVGQREWFADQDGGAEVWNSAHCSWYRNARQSHVQNAAVRAYYDSVQLT
jgi:hypothetical protein